MAVYWIKYLINSGILTLSYNVKINYYLSTIWRSYFMHRVKRGVKLKPSADDKRRYITKITFI